jgi:sodium/potassium/calcium exchanger 6
MDIGLGEPDEGPRPVKWWPYKILPPPHILLGTLFPTLQGWREKSLWDKAISLASVPSILLLVTTLPVVDTEHNDEEDDEDIAAKLASPIIPAVTSTSPSTTIQPESEWQEYRRRSRSIVSRSSIPSPARLSHHSAAPETAPLLVLPEPSQASGPSIATDASSAPEWHRWLVALQLFTGPLFVIFLIWANTSEDLPSPKKALFRMILYSLLVSVVMLAILLLTTSPHKKPKYHSLLCFLGFIISIAWISTIASEVVGVLKTLGVILGISEAILGLTVFAVGNSLGDLVADVTVARLGYPVMALYVFSPLPKSPNGFHELTEDGVIGPRASADHCLTSFLG